MHQSDRYREIIDRCVAQARKTNLPEASRLWLTIRESYEVLSRIEQLVEQAPKFAQKSSDTDGM